MSRALGDPRQNRLRCGQQMAPVCGLGGERSCSPMCCCHLVARKGKACSLCRRSGLNFITPSCPAPILLQTCLSNIQETLPAREEAHLPQLPFLLSYLFPSLWACFLFFSVCTLPPPLPRSNNEGSQHLPASYYAL